ncbi:MAG TPA: phage portal protein [Acidimicrobiales bacterium]
MAGPEQTWPPTRVLPQPSETNALSVPAFWKAHAYVTGTVGMLPARAFRGTDALDPQPGIIRQPDPTQTPMAFWAGVTSALTLYGNAICIITGRDSLGWPASLKPIHPTLAAVRFIGNPMSPTIGAWYVAGQMYDPVDIWHVKSHLGRAGWPLGRGIIDTDSDAIAVSLALQTYAASYFNNGGMPSGILKIHRPEITQAQADQAKADWLAKYSGAPTPAVLNELTDFTPVAYKPIDSQMLESRQFELVNVANMWLIPPSKLGASVGGGTYKNAEMEEVQARNDAIAPWTTLLEQAGSIELLPRGQVLLWDLKAALQTDTLSQYQAYQAALGGPGPQSLWMLPDEIRARENMDPMAIVQSQIDDEVKAAGVVPGPAETAPALPPVAAAPAAGSPAPGPPGSDQQPAPMPETMPAIVGAGNGKGG